VAILFASSFMAAAVAIAVVAKEIQYAT